MALKLSIVIPLYNEEGNLEKLHQQLTAVLDSLNLSYEIIFIDDGSTDKSLAVLEKIYQQKASQPIKIIQLTKNFGKASALSAGFAESEGEIIITMDADLQDDPLEIPKLLAKIDEGYDLVSGWRQERQDSFKKTWPSKIFNKAVAIFSGLEMHDFNCGLKAYQKIALSQVNIYGGLYRFLPVFIHHQGFRVGEVAVEHHHRFSGKSKYGGKRLWQGMLDFLTVILLTNYFTRPIHFFGGLGLLAFFAGFLIDFYLAILRIFTGSIQGHNPLLMLGTLLIIVGVQLLSLGLIGEMMVGFFQQKNKGYLIRKIWK